MREKTTERRLSAAYAGVVDAMILAAQGRPHQSWLVTAALAGDGTTTTAIGIAAALAARNHQALLLDANLKDPCLSRRLAETQSPGLAQLIQNGQRIEEVCRREEQGGFSVVPAGTTGDAAVELLGRLRAAEVLGELSRRYDFVIVDTPALETGLDALALAPHVDGCVLVVRAGKTGRAALLRSKQQIEQAGGKITGLVFNRRRRWVPRL